MLSQKISLHSQKVLQLLFEMIIVYNILNNFRPFYKFMALTKYFYKCSLLPNGCGLNKVFQEKKIFIYQKDYLIFLKCSKKFRCGWEKIQ